MLRSEENFWIVHTGIENNKPVVGGGGSTLSRAESPCLQVHLALKNLASFLSTLFALF